MDNFDLKKYLTESKLLKEEQGYALTIDQVKTIAQKVADEFTSEDNDLDLKYTITPDSIEADERGAGFDLDVEAGPNTPGAEWKDESGFGIEQYLGSYAGGSFYIKDGKVFNAASQNAFIGNVSDILDIEEPGEETDYMQRRKEMDDYAIGENKETKPNKMKKTTVDSKLAEIEKQSQVVALEAKIAAIDEMIETKNQRISMISEDENLSELVDKAKMKVMQREVKDLERRKVKMEKLYEKMCGKSYTKEEIVDEEMSTELNENRKTMKKSELKEMIKAAMMSEINIDIQDTNADYDPLYEENEAMRPFDTNKPARIAAFILALDNLLDEYHAELYLSDDIFAAIEAAKSAAKLEMGREDEMDDMPGFEGTKDSLRSLGLEEAEEEVDAEEVDVEVGDEEVETTDVETTAEVDPNIKAVQDSLTAAQAAAAALGDEKLTDQIGNTITFFTRQHVANIDSMNESINESTVHRGTDGQINRLL